MLFFALTSLTMNRQELIPMFKENRASYKPVVPFDPGKDKLLLLDFTEKNKELTDKILNDTRLFAEYINRKLQNAGARYGIGGYAERRIVYSRSRIFDENLSSFKTIADSPSPLERLEGEVEPRRLHLGIDIWGKPNTALMAPLNGIIHSFAFNNGPGDYGATIILSHQLQGISFYTLYGHLSLNSIKNINEGDRIMQGDIFAEFGIGSENGQWPPHLHFQIIIDPEGWSGDYPGVCKYSERKKYLENCPDPDLILQMNRYLK
jgi:murein DD-endopeptidase MepM/ murein hydrolase activator NlpD